MGELASAPSMPFPPSDGGGCDDCEEIGRMLMSDCDSDAHQSRTRAGSAEGESGREFGSFPSRRWCAVGKLRRGRKNLSFMRARG
jgi:hypothetical protein